MNGVKKLAEKRRKETRERIIQAARDMFSKQGYHNTQVMDIANSLSMSAGTFYKYFKDKRELFLHISRENFINIRNRLKEMRKNQETSDVAKRLNRFRNTFSAFFDFVDEYPEQMLMMFRGGFGVDEELDADFWEEISIAAQDIADDFQQLIDADISGNYNPLVLGHATFGMAWQVAHTYLVDKKFSRDEAIDCLVNISIFTTRGFLTEKGKVVLGND